MTSRKRPKADSTCRPQPARCPACGHALEVIQVHGHGQCATCGTNIDPCCSGAPLETQEE